MLIMLEINDEFIKIKNNKKMEISLKYLNPLAKDDF